MVDIVAAGIELDEPRRRKSDRYTRPANDHDLLTQLWTIVLHSCDESSNRHAEYSRSIAELRKEAAENRSAQNFRVETLSKEIDVRFDIMTKEINEIKNRDAKQMGAWELSKWLVATAIAAASAGVGITMLILKVTGAA